MLNIGDRVLQTSTTQGTGTINLDGTVAGFRSFVAGIGNAKKTVYLINDDTNWEVGIGTITDAAVDTLSRTTILSSSNSGAAVNWGPGTRNVYCVMAAGVSPITDENLNFMYLFGAGGGTANAHTVTMPIAPLALSPDMYFFYRPTVANTTVGFTINVNGTGTKAAKIAGADPGIGFAGIGDVLLCVYKSSNNTIEVLNVSKINEMAYQGRNLTIAQNHAMVTVASAATPDIWGVNGNVINYTGTTTATGFAAAPQAGASRTLICAAAAPFTAGANMLIDGVTSGQTLTTAAGDRVIVTALSTTQFRLQLIRANGLPVVSPPSLTSGTAQATTSGTSKEFLSIPAGTKRITVSISNLSTNGSSLPQIQVGDSGGYKTSGYMGVASTLSGGTSEIALSAGIIVCYTNTGAAATNVRHGSLVLTLIDAATNTWAFNGVFSFSDINRSSTVSGSVVLTNALDKLRLITVNGTDALDLGIINIMYE